MITEDKNRSGSARKNFNTIYTVITIAALVALCASCTKSKVIATLEEDNLFSLQYGNFENQINLFDLAGVGEINTSIAMKNGFFYIANGESKKIMETNSYGDLLSLYYNADVNPVPSFTQNGKSVSATQKAATYPFNTISLIAVDARKYMYVVDKLPIERQEVDSDSKQVLSQIVLRFDDSGNFIDYIGQQGPGGTPFPYVKNVYATSNGELVVISTTGQGFVAYWFSTNGYLLYKVPFGKANIPPMPDTKEGVESWGTVENVIPSYSSQTLYVKVDYYSRYVDEASKVQSGIDYIESQLYPLAVETGVYDKPINIPPYSEVVTSGFSSESYDIPYDFLGVTQSGWFFFIVSTEKGYTVQMVQPNGQKILKRTLTVDHTKNYYYTFALSDDGILSALFAQKDKAIMDWWRTDKLIAAVIKN